jgi:dTDP-4-dehydrorhamnose reductase
MKSKILILGGNGMLGNTLARVLAKNKSFEVFSTLRSMKLTSFFLGQDINFLNSADILDDKTLEDIFLHVRPNVVINCIGLVKQKDVSADSILNISVNSLLPHKISKLCGSYDSRFIHISTDCVFSGRKGNYRESDLPDPTDLYGKSKLLGEVSNPYSLTLRTSIIGHEINTKFGLLEWFLSQDNTCYGYEKAIFSGLPTVILSRFIEKVITNHMNLNGVYHVSSKPISKYDLLLLLASAYRKVVEIKPTNEHVIDRSLDCSLISSITGYKPMEWNEMIAIMERFR